MIVAAYPIHQNKTIAILHHITLGYLRYLARVLYKTDRSPLLHGSRANLIYLAGDQETTATYATLSHGLVP